MKHGMLVLLIVGVFVGVTVALGSIVQTRIGSDFAVGDLKHLMNTQPIMPDMDLPKLGAMPPIERIESWINSSGLTREQLKGKVVLVDFWTYSCVNCLRTLPYVTAWYDKYRSNGFVVIGVHTPEFDFEKDRDNVARAVSDYAIHYPVALDNEYKTWNNFQNRFWPAEYLFDKDGVLRYEHFGEGNYDATETAIQKLIGVDAPDVIGTNVQAYDRIKSPETYLGYKRSERFASPEPIVKDAAAAYSFPSDLLTNTWALEGSWTIGNESAELVGDAGRFRFRYDAGQASVVMDTGDRFEQFDRVLVDGKPVPKDWAGKDITYDGDGNSIVRIEFPKLYELVDGPAGSHLLEIRFVKPHAKVFTVTFGAKANP